MATSANVNDVFPLMLVIVVLALHGNGVQSEVNPGLQFRLSQMAASYASTFGVKKFCELAQTIEIPDQSGSASIYVGDVQYEVNNIKVSGVTEPSSNVAFAPGYAIWTLSGGGVSVESDWRYAYKKWFIKISDSGKFTGSVSDASISVTVNFGLDAGGYPTVSSTDCSCSISSVSIKLSGGASWLYNLFTGFVEKPIRNVLQTKICEAATQVINGKANDMLKTFPLQMAVAKDFLINYRFLSAPDPQIGYLYTRHSATFIHKDDPTDPPIQAEPFPTTTAPDRMLTIWISDYIPNTMGYVLFKRNILKYTLTHRDLPGTINNLGTTCSPEDSCVGSIFPELSEKYPNSYVEVEMACTKEPNTSISASQIQVTFTGAMTCQIRLPDGSVVEILRINVGLTVSVEVTVDVTVLKGKVKRITPTIDVISSSLDSISSDMLSEAVEGVCNSVFVPFLNKRGQEGIQIPVLSGVKFKDLHMEMQDHCLRIGTDAEYIGIP